jgi:predicted RNA-binding Zn ribbon-like protein
MFGSASKPVKGKIPVTTRRQPCYAGKTMPDETPWTFHLTGGALCLDFANTVSWRRSEAPIERLASFADFLAWGRQSGLIDEAEERRLGRLAQRQPRKAAAVLRRARALRETIYRAFSALQSSDRVEAADLEALDAALAQALRHVHVAELAGAFTLVWRPGGRDLERLLWPVAKSAADLLVSTEIPLLRKCNGRTCGWIFLDHSRTRQRRWCDMRVCGNRTKVRNFHARQREAEGAA